MSAKRLSLSFHICEFLRHVFRDSPVILQSLTFHKGSQQPTHIDYPYVRSQKILPMLAASWIPLENINPQSGPLKYYPGSHKTEVSGFFDWGKGSILMEKDSLRTPIEFSNYLDRRMLQKEIVPVTFCPKKGDALIWHGNLAHGGTYIAHHKLTRKSYVTHYTSCEAYPRAHKKALAFLRRKYYKENGGYSFDLPYRLSGVKQIIR